MRSGSRQDSAEQRPSFLVSPGEPYTDHLLELVREFDDRGRIFWAKVVVSVATDREVEVTEQTFAAK